MSLIKCDKSCLHQSEGFCNLEGASKVVSPYEDCCFYCAKKKNNQSSQNCED